MDKRTGGIIATVATTLLCGCPGIFECLFGALRAAGLGKYSGEAILGERGSTSVGQVSPAVGVALLCGGLILILIPFLVGFFTLRRKPAIGSVEVPPTS